MPVNKQECPVLLDNRKLSPPLLGHIHTYFGLMGPVATGWVWRCNFLSLDLLLSTCHRHPRSSADLFAFLTKLPVPLESDIAGFGVSKDTE